MIQRLSQRRLVILDNYDSFTFNLAQTFAAMAVDVTVVRSDEWGLPRLLAEAPDYLVISPGPGKPPSSRRTREIHPREARSDETASLQGMENGIGNGMGICREALRALRGRVPILGVCLGHQLLATELGGTVVRGPVPVHGKRSRIEHDGSGIFSDLPQPLEVARYHSLAVTESSLPDGVRVVARTQDGVVMSITVDGEPTWGVQFHPESFMTPDGPALLENFLALSPSWAIELTRVAFPRLRMPTVSAQLEVGAPRLSRRS